MTVASRTVAASKEDVFALLAGYDGYATWAADVADVMVLEREGDIAYAEFHSPYLLASKYTLELIEMRADWRIRFRQVDQRDRQLSGEWRLTDDPAGVCITGTMNSRMSFWSPRVSWSNRQRVRVVLQRRLDALGQYFSPAGLLLWELPAEPGGEP